ncbi:type II toxin-antitoxin system RelE/ParE family toxin [Rhodoferax antarcticus]|uniref:type II toxin-antitoxin system RelE/ParE family toxin n=1 Tax=Rhodoferax antarcticus TaxID=81479 RepID=UPI002225AC3C|nr:type II toxin-antitoxin system RelE/ParE family toxin [Rhodoferax antarcticus]MCW2311043.1 plasmid stabilization system protein ParE [Rhodoferax antarcticus]
MPRLIWSQPALLDLQRLHHFLVTKSPDAAKRAVTAIRQGVRTLALQPRVGRPAEEFPADYREWMIDFGDSGYIALYHFDGQTAVILAVRHQKKLGY